VTERKERANRFATGLVTGKREERATFSFSSTFATTRGKRGKRDRAFNCGLGRGEERVCWSAPVRGREKKEGREKWRRLF